jgi:hypothetical protein
LPIIVCIVAAIIAIASYVVKLAKYFYVMPFIVAFSVTTRRTDKIFDFLVSGIAIFFKLILITIFVFFALFMHSFIKDVFMFLINRQFLFIQEINENMILAILMGLFQTILVIVCAIGSMYIMWTIIVRAPSWLMKMVGIDGANADMFTESLASRLERHSFQV